MIAWIIVCSMARGARQQYQKIQKMRDSIGIRVERARGRLLHEHVTLPKLGPLFGVVVMFAVAVVVMVTVHRCGALASKNVFNWNYGLKNDLRIH